MSAKKIKSTAEAWESGLLGRDAAHAKPAPLELQRQVEESLGLQMISIRLPKELIEDYKKIADFHGVGYQHLMREMLKSSIEAEFKRIATAYLDSSISKAPEKSVRPRKLVAETK